MAWSSEAFGPISSSVIGTGEIVIKSGFGSGVGALSALVRRLDLAGVSFTRLSSDLSVVAFFVLAEVGAMGFFLDGTCSSTAALALDLPAGLASDCFADLAFGALAVLEVGFFVSAFVPACFVVFIAMG